MDAFDYTINIDNIAKILEKNFGFSLIDDPLIKNQIALELSPQEAFTLSLVQGATYLVSKTGVSFRDRLEVFIHRGVFQNNKYIYSPGLFGRDIEGNLVSGNAPLEIFSKFPSLQQRKKILLFRSTSGSYGSNIEQQTFEELENHELDPSDFMIFKFSDNLTYLEPFFEYLSCKAFDRLGYFTESQTPWFQQSYQGLTGGIPDYSLFYIKEFDELKDKRLLPDTMLIQNLSTLFAWRDTHNTIESDYTFSLGEVKSSKSNLDSAKNQLDGYSKVNLAENCYATLYDQTDALGKYGLVNLDEKFQIKIIPSTANLKIDSKLRNDDAAWILDYAKMYLLSNLSFDELADFIHKKTRKRESDNLESFDLLHTIKKSSFGEIVDLISSNL